ncbi:MAG: 3-phosphoshikimate 1-carboxyvinyltransferase [Clostridiaceae bacterium]|nr:3-phosphoshikimate 1-carboxyvinyltransferase [Clostridiaceae bacterium]
MKVKINPSQAEGCITVPPSKSMAHRVLICAGLAEGQSQINNVVLSEDISATLDCLQALGAKWKINDKTIFIDGTNLKKCLPQDDLNCRESGSTLRFFLPLALANGNKIRLTGSKYLLKRPLDVYHNIALERNLLFEHQTTSITVQGPLIHGQYTIPGNISSQFATGLLFALPLLQGDSLLKIIPPIESFSYILMTIAALREFGIDICSNSKTAEKMRMVKITQTKNNTESLDNIQTIINTQNVQSTGISLKIQGNQKFKPGNKTVEGDYSNAAFLEAFNLFGGKVKVKGLNTDSLQGDAVYPELFTLLTTGNPQISLKNCPDLGPILFAVAAAFNGATFFDTKRLAIKESDRANAMAEELAKFGIKVNVEKNSVQIMPGILKTPNKILMGHNDHRIVMSLAILCSITGGIIEGAEAVTKSYPDFFKIIEQLGIELEYIE